MSERAQIIETPPHYDVVVAFMTVFFPQYFDPDSPSYVDPEIMKQLIWLAEEARPWCLPEGKQDFAQAMYAAYLVSLRSETSSGSISIPVAGPIVSEKEGDIQVNYAAPASGGSTSSASKRPASDPWDAWNKLWSICGRGAITTRFGDPMRNGVTVSNELVVRARAI